MTTREHRLSKDRRTLTTSPVKTVAICGGTHGNETNGVYLAKYFMTNKTVVDRPSFDTTVLLTNTAAVQANQRYVETDMNRCFQMADLANPALDTLEEKRAKEIDALLGPKSAVNPKADFVIDMHNTTANTGVALLMDPTDHFAHEVAAHLVSVDPAVRIVNWAQGKDDYGLLPSIGRSGMTFEVGACPCGCIIGAWYQKSVEMIVAALDYVHAHNQAVSGPKRPRDELSQMQVVYDAQCWLYLIGKFVYEGGNLSARVRLRLSER